MASSSITWADVEGFDSALSAISISAQSTIIAYVNSILVPAEFGGDDDPRLRLARIYLAAHYGTITLDGKNGSVVSKTVGPISVTYASSTGSSNEYESTVWGKAFLSIVRVSPARAPVVV